MEDFSQPPRAGILTGIITNLGRVALAVFFPVMTFLVLWQGFVFLRDTQANLLIIIIVAILWGVGGVALLFLVSNWLVEQLPDQFRRGLLPFVFVGPAVAILMWYLTLPTIRTFWISLFDRTGDTFIWLDNYVRVFTEQSSLLALRNNLLWIVVGATSCVVMGLLIAVLADRSGFEKIAKALIFMPMAISMVGSSVIWKFVYEYSPPGNPQIGILNAIMVQLGNPPQAWLQLVQPWNNLFLIVILVWLQTGFAMVLFSAAIKGVPEDLLEAARVDGANEIQIFMRIIIPFIQGTIITVSTTIVIFTLKLFDIVRVMTGGNFGTNVIANEFYEQYFTQGNFGLGSAISIILLILVTPVMIYNLIDFSKREAF